MPINHQNTITLNGVPQYVSIRAERDHLPLLLYLHGGPGDAALPLVLKYNSELEKHFTVVVWEQRGAGKSYYDFGDSNVTVRKSSISSDIPGEASWGLPIRRSIRRRYAPMSDAARW